MGSLTSIPKIFSACPCYKYPYIIKYLRLFLDFYSNFRMTNLVKIESVTQDQEKLVSLLLT